MQEISQNVTSYIVTSWSEPVLVLFVVIFCVCSSVSWLTWQKQNKHHVPPAQPKTVTLDSLFNMEKDKAKKKRTLLQPTIFGVEKIPITQKRKRKNGKENTAEECVGDFVKFREKLRFDFLAPRDDSPAEDFESIWGRFHRSFVIIWTRFLFPS